MAANGRADDGSKRHKWVINGGQNNSPRGDPETKLARVSLEIGQQLHLFMTARCIFEPSSEAKYYVPASNNNLLARKRLAMNGRSGR